MDSLHFHDVFLAPRSDRVLARPFLPEGSRLDELVSRVAALSDVEAAAAFTAARHSAEPRHRNVTSIWEANRARAAAQTDLSSLGSVQAELLGALLTCEYAIEGAALTNPSIVTVGQRGRAVEFVLSARAIGEGHISSVVFVTGSAGKDPTTGELSLSLAERPRFATTGVYTESGGGYKVSFSGVSLAERTLFPHHPSEASGMEDVRFVAFTEPVVPRYCATYTAYDGRRISGRLLSTDDFATFHSRPLSGPGAQNKGVALFPRRVGGRWVAATRTDGVSLGLSTSDDLVFWDAPSPLYTPARSWEIYQVGNCGSPVETSEGWLLLTHGVGAMRHYSLGAILLDLDDPSSVIGALPAPLITPSPSQRDGYVPNVAYTCGATVVDDVLLIPYGLADRSIAFASLPVADLLCEMR